MSATAFYLRPDFWIGALLGAASVGFSLLAFLEARRAKTAATEAGKTVKIQTITIELTEIAQRLDKLDSEITFADARDLLNEVSRRLRRLIAPFQSNPDLEAVCSQLREALDEAKSSLQGVRPLGEARVSRDAVYFATQGHFATVSVLVAEILGLLEKRTLES